MIWRSGDRITVEPSEGIGEVGRRVGKFMGWNLVLGANLMSDWTEYDRCSNVLQYRGRLWQSHYSKFRTRIGDHIFEASLTGGN